MATTIRAQVNIQNVNSIPRDVAMNTWHFRSAAVDRLDDCTAITDALGAFYISIDGLYSPDIEPDVIVRYYDLGDPQPRAPIQEDTFEMTPLGSITMPHEVAICLSYNGAPSSGLSPARNRGRIYLGPWGIEVMADGAGDSIVDPGVTGAIASSAATLVDAGEGQTWFWAVFSPTTAGPEPWSPAELAASTFPVTHGFVNNSFDTVRSRGIDATARSVFP